ncbi:MAG: hypothetical protein IJ660_05690 [Alphaproteobacteria bacterium]|nr:hypothetical protein [Alphaproteobacteria bacterium]
MELQLDNGEYQVVFRDSNLNITIEESAPLNVIVGESARIEVGEAINYIKTGQKEIGEAVQEEIASFDSNAQEKTDEFNDNYTEKKDLIDAQVDIAEEQAQIATSQAQTATVQASSATASANRASVSETNAKTSELSAYNSEQSASQSATTATTQAGIATTKAGEASTSASNALASETSASNSALSASSSANLAKQWAIGDPSEPVGNSAKYWAGQAQAELSGLTSRVSTIEGKIPSSASSSNQLVDKNYVDTEDNNLQTQIDATIQTTGSSLDYTGTTLSLENAQGTVLSSVTIKSTPDLDNTTISLNSSSELQAIGIVNKNNTGATNPVYDWVGTLQEYETQQVETLHPDWICYITDDVSGGTSVYTKTQVNNLLATKADSTDVNNAITAMLEGLYPVGSIYIGTTSTCPIASLISGSTWTLVSSDRVLQGSSSSHTAGSTVEAGLPNITGTIGNRIEASTNPTATGALYVTTTSGGGEGNGNYRYFGMGIDASRSSSIYGNSTTVQPPAYVVNIWQRTA